ncbi:uncharacterized protein [Triticum aestivum]|uniref:uncharacterized protein n=1 Tax=Triticum aestivum TaxID=4565 RepID=UPI001D018A97|nr:uncharacterized protein LOC123070183 [Triticum aestivum]
MQCVSHARTSLNRATVVTVLEICFSFGFSFLSQPFPDLTPASLPSGDSGETTPQPWVPHLSVPSSPPLPLAWPRWRRPRLRRWRGETRGGRWEARWARDEMRRSRRRGSAGSGPAGCVADGGRCGWARSVRLQVPWWMVQERWLLCGWLRPVGESGRRAWIRARGLP